MEVPHAIDAMHVQKNVFESLIATLMDTGKSKDGLKSRKVPTRFSVKVKKLVPMKDLSITHCKARDCHVMLTVFLPIAIRAIKLEFLKITITRMCYFFLKIS